MFLDDVDNGHVTSQCIILEAGQYQKELEVVEDALSDRLVQMISGPSPSCNTSPFQLTMSSAYLAMRDGLDLDSMGKMLSGRPSHLMQSPYTVDNIKEKVKVGNNCFTADDLETL